MRIAITADVHLASKKTHPERYNAFIDILEKVSKQKIEHLIIAGDLFDAAYNNYAEFDRIASQYKQIKMHIIPGNHDQDIDSKVITSKNIEVYTKPIIKNIDLKFLFLPYDNNVVMGKAIASNADSLKPNQWILVGHGDWESGMKASNPLEPGVYMPLSQRDINAYKPAHTFLGHIHKPTDEELLCYPGSPCGLDINETGKRRFLIFDTKDLSVLSKPIETDFIFFNETFSILPLDDEESYIKKQIKQRVKGWEITSKEIPNVRIRVKIRGYSTDKRKLKEVVDEEFKDYMFYDDEIVDLSNVFKSANIEREEISRRVATRIEQLNWPQEPYQPSHDDILFHALKTIYGDD